MKQASLLILIDKQRVLLAMKKRGFGVGRWNGVGGKPKSGEAITATAIRECQEEIGVTPIKIIEAARLNFYFPKAKEVQNQQVVVFICNSWLGEPVETEEMSPKWFDIDELPYLEMWPDDKHWLPKVIEGKYVAADFYFDDHDNLLKHNIKSRPRVGDFMQTIVLPATLEGTVKRFKGNGRKLGYPTANIDTHTALLDGIYFGFADLHGYTHHPSIIFIGTPTTVGDTGRRVEAHLIDVANRDYYDLPLTITLQHYHRPNQTLSSVDELLIIMRKDEATARQWFQEHL